MFANVFCYFCTIFCYFCHVLCLLAFFVTFVTFLLLLSRFMLANVFCYVCNIFCSCFHAKKKNNKNNKASFRTFERCSRSKKQSKLGPNLSSSNELTSILHCKVVVNYVFTNLQKPNHTMDERVLSFQRDKE